MMDRCSLSLAEECGRQ